MDQSDVRQTRVACQQSLHESDMWLQSYPHQCSPHRGAGSLNILPIMNLSITPPSDTRHCSDNAHAVPSRYVRKHSKENSMSREV